LYEVEQIAEIMRCSEDYARAQLRERVWPGVKIAGRWHMTEQQIIDAIGSQSTEATTTSLPPAQSPPKFRRRRQVARSA
jgi:hypothetical protein